MKLKLSLLAVFGLLISCSQTPDQSGHPAWEMTTIVGNWTTGFPRAQIVTTVDSNGTIKETLKSIDVGGTDTITSEKSAKLSGEEIAKLESLINSAGVKTHAQLDISGGCVGGGAVIYKFKEAGKEVNEFSVVGGCGSSLKENDEKLSDLEDEISKLKSSHL